MRMDFFQQFVTFESKSFNLLRCPRVRSMDGSCGLKITADDQTIASRYYWKCTGKEETQARRIPRKRSKINVRLFVEPLKNGRSAYRTWNARGTHEHYLAQAKHPLAWLAFTLISICCISLCVWFKGNAELHTWNISGIATLGYITHITPLVEIK